MASDGRPALIVAAGALFVSLGTLEILSGVDPDRLASHVARRITAEENDQRRYVLGDAESPKRGFLDYQIPDKHRRVLL